MGKNKRRDQSRHQSNGNAAAAITSAVASAQTSVGITPPQEVIQRAEEIALSNVTEEDIESLPAESNADQPAERLGEWAQRAGTAIALLDRQRIRYEERI